MTFNYSSTSFQCIFHTITGRVLIKIYQILSLICPRTAALRTAQRVHMPSPNPAAPLHTSHPQIPQAGCCLGFLTSSPWCFSWQSYWKSPPSSQNDLYHSDLWSTALCCSEGWFVGEMHYTLPEGGEFVPALRRRAKTTNCLGKFILWRAVCW